MSFADNLYNIVPFLPLIVMAFALFLIVDRNLNSASVREAPPAAEHKPDSIITAADVFSETLFARVKSSAPSEPNHSAPEPEQHTADPPKQEPPPTLPPKPSQPFANSGPVKSMSLRLKRGERAGAFGKLIFTLDARIDVSAENRALIEKYKLGSRVIYESASRRKHAERTADHLENSRDNTSMFASSEKQFLGVGKTFFNLGRAAFSAAAAALSLRITVDSLMSGVHVECKDMAELLEAEEAIVEAGQNLKAEIEAARTFTGQEQVIEL